MPPSPSKTNPPNERENPVNPQGTGPLLRSARPAVAAYLILSLGSALAAAMACSSDTAAVDEGSEPVGNAAAGGNSGSGNSGSGNSGGGNSGSGNSGGTAAGGAVNVAGTGSGGGQNSAGAAGTAEELPEPEFGPNDTFPECSTGDSSEPCNWSLSSAFTGAACTPGEQLLIGCCDCGPQWPPLMRICDGSTSCNAKDSIGLVNVGCGLCPLTEFTCPASGVFSALTGAYPNFEFNPETQQDVPIPAPPAPCQPKLISLSGGGLGSDAGSVRFDEVHPVLVTNCGRCHALETGLGDLLSLPPFAGSDLDVAYEAAVSLGTAILAQVNAGVMPPDTCQRLPPGSPGCVSVDNYELIRSWFAAGTPR